MEQLNELITERKSLEDQIQALLESLKQQQNLKDPMNSPLVDEAGYPRSDIDVFLVRTTRCRIIELVNDFNALTNRIEAELGRLHSKEVTNSNKNHNPSEKTILWTWALVDMVSPDSPAEEAGLETGDQILKFGNLCDRGETGPDKLFQSLPASVVEGTPIKLVVYRDPNLKDSTKCKRTRICVEDESRILELVLTPKRWDGRGLLVMTLLAVHAADNCQYRPDCWDRRLECAGNWSLRCNGQMCKHVCESVAISENLEIALSLQRSLQRDRPYTKVEMLGTHNSYIAPQYDIGLEEDYSGSLLRKAGLQFNEVVIANQRLSLRDQLRLGVRHIELDIHYLPPITGNEVRLCHWDVTPPQFPLLVYVMYHKVYKGKRSVKWDWKRVGCSRRSNPISTGLQEIRQWLDENPKEFLAIYLDNRVPKSRLEYTIDVIEREIGREKIFTPLILETEFNSEWPTPEKLTSGGYQVLLENNDNFNWNVSKTAQEKLFLKQNAWKEFEIYQLGSNCQINGFAFASQQRTRLLDNSNMLGPSKLFNMTKAAVDPNMISFAQECGVNILSLDQIRPDIVSNSIWTFDLANIGKSALRNNNSCFVLDIESRFWRVESCEYSTFYLCRESSDSMSPNWTVSDIKGTHPKSFQSLQSVQCPPGYKFDVPRTRSENVHAVNRIKAQAPGVLSVWLNAIS